jgi:hypothetical protein
VTIASGRKIGSFPSLTRTRIKLDLTFPLKQASGQGSARIIRRPIRNEIPKKPYLFRSPAFICARYPCLPRNDLSWRLCCSQDVISCDNRRDSFLQLQSHATLDAFSTITVLSHTASLSASLFKGSQVLPPVISH